MDRNTGESPIRVDMVRGTGESSIRLESVDTETIVAKIRARRLKKGQKVEVSEKERNTKLQRNIP